MLSDIIQNRYAVTAVILFGIGFTNLMLQQNLLRKVIGFNIMDSAIFMLLASLVLGGIALVQKLLGQALGGFTTVILIQLFSSSLVMISLGIIGYYLAKLYEEIKDRPRYLIAETCGEDRHASSHEKTP